MPTVLNDTLIQKSLHGRQIGLGLNNELIVNQELLTGNKALAQALIQNIRTITFTNSEILDWDQFQNANALLVAQPAAGYYNVVDEVLMFKPAGVAYTIAGNAALTIVAGTQTVATQTDALTIANAASRWTVFRPITHSQAGGTSPIHFFTAGGAAVGGGDAGNSPISVQVRYRVLPEGMVA